MIRPVPQQDTLQRDDVRFDADHKFAERAALGLPVAAGHVQMCSRRSGRSESHWHVVQSRLFAWLERAADAIVTALRKWNSFVDHLVVRTGRHAPREAVLGLVHGVMADGEWALYAVSTLRLQEATVATSMCTSSSRRSQFGHSLAVGHSRGRLHSFH